MPAAEKPGFVSYSIQRVDRPDANYMLFWLQNSSNEHTLGIVVNILCCSILCSLLYLQHNLFIAVSKTFSFRSEMLYEQGRDARHNKKWKYKTHPDLTAYPAYTSDTK